MSRRTGREHPHMDLERSNFLVDFHTYCCCCLEHFWITIFADPECDWDPPGWPCGRCPIHVKLQRSDMLLAPVPVMPVGLVISWLDGLERLGLNISRPCRFVDVLLTSMQLSKIQAEGPAMWVVRQLCWWLGRRIDDAAAFSIMDLQAGETRSSRLGESITAREKSLMRYWLAARRAFSESSILHVGMDAGSLLKKPTVAGLIAEPSGTAVVFPPQAGGSVVQQPVSRSTNFFLRTTKVRLASLPMFLTF